MNKIKIKLGLQNKSMISGFGLIEVLITSVILGVGLLGLVSSLTKSGRLALETENYITAAMLANEAAQRISIGSFKNNKGKKGYIYNDHNAVVTDATDIPTWVDSVRTAAVQRCYAQNATESCFADGASVNVAANHLAAFDNLHISEEAELRELVWDLLPEGRIRICLDKTDTFTTWECDNASTYSIVWAANKLSYSIVYTIKIRWKNLIDNSWNLHVIGVPHKCNNSDSSECGP